MAIVMQEQMSGMMGGMMGGGMMGMQDAGSTGPGKDTFNNAAQSQQGWQNGGDIQSYQGPQRGGRGRGRGRSGARGGGFGYGRGGSGGGSDAGYAGHQEQRASFDSNQDGGWGNGGAQPWATADTQAWEVGNANGVAVPEPPSAPSAPTSQIDDGESPMTRKHGGQMVKIGDRWQWVPAG
ncbi:hypothetical protein CALVIDRAFT_566991 [Calocera viscosa TUFC12733]|uniref:Uncharacterized protein n=1 Tax=Calocera viscosa (strain TUFC12733) TaxID=1330018 RepID=A0A167IRJ5_CALVF|nr:hypothetical protein CALVIDRAFT_566991 [Calocera viscosa TUFC12733]